MTTSFAGTYLPALFSIMTAKEINRRLNTLRLEEPSHFRNGTFFEDMTGMWTLPSVDWRKSGLVNPVQNKVTHFNAKK